MPAPLKTFRVRIELEVAVNPITRESFKRVPEDVDEPWILNHVQHQVALQTAILSNPDVLEPYLRTVVSGHLDGNGGNIGAALFGEEDYPTVEDLALEYTPSDTTTFFTEAVDDGLMAENTEELMDSFVVKAISGTISEI